MKINKICTVFVLLLVMLTFAVARAQTYEKLWKQVVQAEKKDLPQTVISLTSEIYRKAKAEKEVPQMLKAYTWRMKYRESLTPDSFFVDLKGLEQWAAMTNESVERAVLHSLIAEMVANYAQMNQWEIRRRTELEAGEIPSNIAEWSKNLFINKVLEQSGEALSDASLLFKTSARTYIPFVELGKTSDYYHHDMYHLLASRSIEELGRLKGLGDDSRLNARIEAIYGELLKTYRKPGDEDALVLTTLDYLKWRKSSDVKFRPYRAPRGLIGLTQDPYVAGLNKLIAEYGSHDICAEVYLAKAQAAVNDNAPVPGLQLCEEAIAKYPRYERINALKNLKEDILRPSLTVGSSQVVYPDDSFALKVNHKNLKGFKVNLYKLNLATMPREQKEITPAYLKKNARLLSSVHYALQVPDNYQTADTTFQMHAPGVGLYALEVVPDQKTDSYTSRYLSVTRFKVLAREVPGGQDEVVVLDSKTGQPIADVKLSIYTNKNVLRLTKTTVANGKVELTWEKNDAYLMAAKGTDTAMPVFYGYFNNYRYSENRQSAKQVTLLTDRGLYRPGQTVYVKGVMYNQYVDSAHVVANEATVLTLTDANGQEVGRKELRTNEFGSFTADFVLPTVCLNGNFRLSADGGSAFIRVEEYKRPTFDITFDPVKESYRLGDVVQVQGKVQTYSGVPLQELPAQYVVTRSVRSWGSWGMDETILASDSVRLNNDGGFAIPVKLVPDAAYQTEEGMYFEYQVKVTVTNLAGETQTSVATLAAGARSLILNAQLPDLINRDNVVKVTFLANNLNLQPVKVDGTYQLYAVTDYVGSKTIKEQKIASDPTLSGVFTSNVEMELNGWQPLPSGAYKLVVSAKDDQGRAVQTEKIIILFSTKDNRPPVYSPMWLYVANDVFDAAHPAEFCFGTSEKEAYVMMDLFCGNQWLESKALNLSDSVMRFVIPYKEEYGYGVVATFALVKNGLLYTQDVRMTKRLPDRKLSMKWEVFRDKLRPGQQEEWKLTIRTPQGKAANAEMLATMYDASLDKIWKTDQSFNIFYNLPLPSPTWRQSYADRNYFGYWFPGRRLDVPELVYDRFALYPSFGRPESDRIVPAPFNTYARSRGVMMKEALADVKQESLIQIAEDTEPLAGKAAFEEELVPAGQVSGLRTNFAETAFFYPQLRTNEQGEVSVVFTMPQSLTTWNFRGYSHTKDMMIGRVDTTAVTSKEFMLTPNLPRFVRVGDQTGIAATVANLTGKNLNGVVQLVLFDPLAEKVISTQKQKFAVKAGETTSVNFQFTVTDKQELLGCRMVADGGTFSDGEQQLLPVLNNKEQVTETLPLFVAGEASRDYSLAALFNNHSKTATDRRLTVEVTGNPAWYAVQALPSLAQPQNDNALSWATAYYANTLSSYIMNRYPRIRAVFESWKQQGGTKDTFLSNLQKNQEVKNILLQETPWVLQATTEQERKERLATLFDLNNIANNNRAAVLKLRDLQLGNGAWSWYKGMNGNRQLTEYIVELNARLQRKAGVPMNREFQEMQQAAFGYLHREALAEYHALKKAEKEGQKSHGLSGYALKYMYLIALSGEQVPAANKQAYDYFLSEVGSTLTSQTVVEKAHAVIILRYNERTSVANDFVASLKEYLVPFGDGLMVAAAERSSGGLNADISTQVAVMEAFQSSWPERLLIGKMKVWLLQQKRAQQWNSPVATADAVFALFYEGMDLVGNDGDVRVTVGSQVIDSQSKDRVVGLGYVEETFTDRKTVDAKMLSIEKQGEGIAWGAVYAQYEENISQVAQQGGELNVERKLYVEKMINNVPQLQPVTSSTRLSVGDKVVSRMTIRLARAMDFIQLKEQRAACFEPVEALSGYRWSDGAGYYASVNDASSNFFFDHLNKGVYVLEYSYRVNRTGVYETGLTTVQSAYAPEYAAHSASVRVKVD